MCYVCPVNKNARSWEQALEAAEAVFCVSHPKPDGDAVGSLLGLYHTLRQRGKNVTLAVPDPVPQYLRFLPGVEHIYTWEESASALQAAASEAELFICVDFGKWDRLPEGLRILIDPARLLWVDHHADSEPLAEVWNFWEPAAAATTEILYRQVLRPWFKEPLPPPARIALYTGLVTDTGGFRFRSVTPQTLQIAAELIAPPFPLEAIHHHIFQRKKLSVLQLQSYLIQQHLRRVEGLPVWILPVPAEALERYGLAWEHLEGLPNQLLALEETLLVVVLKEYPDSTRISLRSVGEFPCHELAQRFDVGGGHRNAAGATLYRPLAEATTFVEDLIRTEYAESLLEHYRLFLAALELQRQF